MNEYKTELKEVGYLNLKIEAQYIVALHDYLERNGLFGTYKEARAQDALKSEIERIMIEDYKAMVEQEVAKPHKDPVEGFKEFVNELTDLNRKEVAEAKRAMREVASTNERNTD
jgi:hypothetical protein